MPRVYAGTDDDIGLDGMPIDIGDSTIVGPENMLDGSTTGEEQVPDQAGYRAMNNHMSPRHSRGTHSFSLEVETMYSWCEGCGFHWTSATSQVPP